MVKIVKTSNTKQLSIWDPIDTSCNHISCNTTDDEQNVDWQIVSRYIKEGFGELTYNRWLKYISCAGIDTKRNIMLLCVPTDLIRDAILHSYFKDIAAFVYKHCTNVKKIELVVKTKDYDAVEKNSSRPKPVTLSQYDISTDRTSGVELMQTHNKQTQLSSLQNTIYDATVSFDSFICGESNKLAYWSAIQTADMILQSTIKDDIFPCLCIFGSVGMGKTHLLKSIASHVKQNNQECKIAYFSAEQFKQHYIHSVRTQQLFEFKRWFANLDAMIIDDVQFICSSNANSKGSIEKEFSRILDNLIESHKWVIIACDRPPSNLQLDLRSKSRITSGLTVNIQRSEFDLRFRILQSKVYKMQQDEVGIISATMLKYIAERVSSSIRELEAILYNIITYAKIMNVKNIGNDVIVGLIDRVGLFDTTAVQNNTINHKMSSGFINTNYTFSSILERVCAYYDVNISDVTGTSRVQKVSRARSVVAYLARKHTSITLKEIGTKLGNRNHSTIMHLIRLCKNDAEIEKIMAY